MCLLLDIMIPFLHTRPIDFLRERAIAFLRKKATSFLHERAIHAFCHSLYFYFIPIATISTILNLPSSVNQKATLLTEFITLIITTFSDIHTHTGNLCQAATFN